MSHPKIPKSHGKTRIGSIWLDLSDGGGLIISPTKNGGIVITHVPPREPVTGSVGLPASIVVDPAKLTASQIRVQLRTGAALGKSVMEAINMLGGKFASGGSL